MAADTLYEMSKSFYQTSEGLPLEDIQGMSFVISLSYSKSTHECIYLTLHVREIKWIVMVMNFHRLVVVVISVVSLTHES